MTAQTLRAEFYILLHQHGWTYDKVERWIYDEFDRILEVNEDSAAMHVSPKILHQVIYFGPDAVHVMSVAHECLHATFSVMKNVGQTSFNEEEPLCYLHGLIVQKVQGFIDEAEKSKSQYTFTSPMYTKWRVSLHSKALSKG